LADVLLVSVPRSLDGTANQRIGDFIDSYLVFLAAEVEKILRSLPASENWKPMDFNPEYNLVLVNFAILCQYKYKLREEAEADADLCRYDLHVRSFA
jgi:hypothetical protein